MTILDVAAGVFLALIALIVLGGLGWLFLFLVMPKVFDARDAVRSWLWQRKVRNWNRSA